jgi:hypothetical protein
VLLDRHRRAEGGDARAHIETHPAQLACASHLRWLYAFGEEPARRSPWAPLVALFERGAWPVALGDGSLLVYVPVLREGGVVPSPESPEVLALAHRVVVMHEGRVTGVVERADATEEKLMAYATAVTDDYRTEDSSPVGAKTGGAA